MISLTLAIAQHFMPCPIGMSTLSQVDDTYSLPKQSMTWSVHSHCGCFVYICLLEAHLHPGAHYTIPWLLIVDSRSVYHYTILNILDYSLWTPVLAPRSSLSRSTKWLAHFFSPKSLSQATYWTLLFTQYWPTWCPSGLIAQWYVDF